MKKISRLLLVLVIGLMFNSTVLAESKWDTINPEKLVSESNDNFIVEYDLSKIKFGWYIGGAVTVNITLTENYNEKSIVIAPEVFQKIAKAVYDYNKKIGYERIDEDNIQYSNPFQSGDKIRVNIVINNYSKNDYYFDDTSFEIFPTEPVVYDKVEGNTGDKFFNQIDIPNGFTFRRNYNTALKELVPNSSGRNMTDENIDEALKENGYNGIEDYAKYLLDFYNKKYNTNYSRLDSFSKGIIREILSDTDPIYAYNSAYAALGLDMIDLRRYDTAKKAIDKAIKSTDFTSPIQYLLYFYNNNDKFNCNGTCKANNLSELNETAVDDLFGFVGTETGGYDFATETNSTILALAYNYFYNEGLSFYFDEKDETTGEYKENKDLSNSNITGTDYSIGSYMRDNSKGNNEISERAGILKSNSTSTISGVLKNIGRYTPNSYIGFDFMVNMQFTYSIKEGTVITNYVDSDGNKLIDEITITDKVGNEYITEKKDFEGYTFITVEGETEGTYIDGVIYVTYYYDKNTGTGNIEILPPQTGFNGSNITTTNVETITLYKKEERELI